MVQDHKVLMGQDHDHKSRPKSPKSVLDTVRSMIGRLGINNSFIDLKQVQCLLLRLFSPRLKTNEAKLV